MSISRYRVFDAETITKNTTSTSGIIKTSTAAQEGYFSVEYTITGDGTLTLAYTVCSDENGTFFTPTGASSIAAGLTKTSGDGAGHGGLSFEPPPFPFMKITATETVKSSDAVLTLILNVQ